MSNDSADNRKLGKIKEVEITSAFKDEAEFTSWLNDNLSLLNLPLGLSMHESAIAHDGSIIYGNIVSKDSITEDTIIIENQFGETNHDHLGNILTYASAQSAKIIIWIAEEFTEEHQEALDWLNQNLDPKLGLSFYGAEFSLIRIGDSLIAPDFRVTVRPNGRRKDDDRIVLPELKSKNENFFRELSHAWSKTKSNDLPDALDPILLRMELDLNILDLHYIWKISHDNLLVELVVNVDTENGRKLYQMIKSDIAEIEKQVGQTLSFDERPTDGRCTIYVVRTLKEKDTISIKKDYSEIINWSIVTMKSLLGATKKYIDQTRDDFAEEK